jgi:hypothetical protein
VTETAETGSPLGQGQRLSLRPHRPVWAIAYSVAMIAVAILSYKYGVSDGNHEVAASQGAIQRLQADNLNLTVDNRKLQADLADLQAKHGRTQDMLDALMPTANKYQIGPNQSLLVANDRLTIGLIGTPGSESVELNINSKQYTAAAGDIINIAIEPSSTCRIEVSSFDVLKSQVTVNAVCSEPSK